jgi:hypothetical protein
MCCPVPTSKGCCSTPRSKMLFEDAVRRRVGTVKLDAREYYLRVFIGMDMDIEYLYLLSGTSPAAADELLAKMLFDAAWVR